tara:strand:- start:3 stop:227 length:225 start_codon:yes stop_codon:yes gene_type:complete
MGGSIGNVLGEIAKPLQQVGGMLGDSPMGAMMPGEDPLTQGAMQSLPGGKMAKKGNELMGGSSLTRNLKRRMMG